MPGTGPYHFSFRSYHRKRSRPNSSRDDNDPISYPDMVGIPGHDAVLLPQRSSLPQLILFPREDQKVLALHRLARPSHRHNCITQKSIATVLSSCYFSSLTIDDVRLGCPLCRIFVLLLGEVENSVIDEQPPAPIVLFTQWDVVVNSCEGPRAIIPLPQYHPAANFVHDDTFALWFIRRENDSTKMLAFRSSHLQKMQFLPFSVWLPSLFFSIPDP